MLTVYKAFTFYTTRCSVSLLCLASENVILTNRTAYTVLSFGERNVYFDQWRVSCTRRDFRRYLLSHIF